MEKDGDYDDIMQPSIKFKRGGIACLQNLIPNSEEEEQISDIYTHASSICSVAPLDLEHLKFVLLKEPAKLVKLWQLLSYRLIIIHHEKLKEF